MHIQTKPRHLKTVGMVYANAKSEVTNILYRYPTHRGPANTLATLRHILTACPTLKLSYVYGKTSVSFTLRLKRLPTPPGLRPHSIALEEDQLRHGRLARWIDDVYQPDGNILSLVYVLGPHPGALVAHAARASAHNLD